MKFNPLVIIMALCVVAEIALGVAKQPVPPIIEHLLLVLLGVLVPQESLQPQSVQSVTKTEVVTPPIDTDPQQPLPALPPNSSAAATKTTRNTRIYSPKRVLSCRPTRTPGTAR